MNDKPKIIYLRGHHLRILKIFISEGEEEIRRRIVTAKLYGAIEEERKKFADISIEILKNILICGTAVKIIDTTDDICLNCRHKDTLMCKYRYSGDDQRTAEEYGLEINKIYSSEKIRSAIEQKIFAEKAKQLKRG